MHYETKPPTPTESMKESLESLTPLVISAKFETECITEMEPTKEPDLSRLPSAADMEKKEQEALIEFRKAQREWSDPVYKCPKCNQGGMRKEQHMMYASNPPSYKYKCDKCGHIEWRHI